MPQSQWTAGPAPAADAWSAGEAPVVSSPDESDAKPLNTRERVVSGALNALKSMGTTAIKASGVPGLFREGIVGTLKDQAEVAKQLFYDPPAEMLERARNAETSSEQQAYGAAALLPVAGPMAGHIGAEIAEGRAPEVAGEVLAGSVLPFVPKGARAAMRGGEAAAASVGGMVPSGARAALLARAAKYAAKQVIPPIIVEGADMALGALRKNAATGETPAAISAPRPMADDPPPPVYAPTPISDPTPVASPSIATEPNPLPRKTQPSVKATAPKKSAAEQLSDKMSAKELTRVRKALGTQDVKIVRYEPRQDSSGKFVGVSDPVYVMPAEFVEQAQTMGLRARGHTALEKSYRSQLDAPKPMVAYHGTTKDFKEFAMGDAPGWGEGIYFTDNAEQAASEFGHGGRVIKAEVTIKNPYRGEHIDNATIRKTKAWKDLGDEWHDPQDAFAEDGRFVGKLLRELGYDGIITEPGASNGINGREVVAFKHDQVKQVNSEKTKR